MKEDDFFRLYFYITFGDNKTAADIWETPTVLQALAYLEYKQYINEEIGDTVKRIEAENRLRYGGLLK